VIQPPVYDEKGKDQKNDKNKESDKDEKNEENQKDKGNDEDDDKHEPEKTNRDDAEKGDEAGAMDTDAGAGEQSEQRVGQKRPADVPLDALAEAAGAEGVPEDAVKRSAEEAFAGDPEGDRADRKRIAIDNEVLTLEHVDEGDGMTEQAAQDVLNELSAIDPELPEDLTKKGKDRELDQMEAFGLYEAREPEDLRGQFISSRGSFRTEARKFERDL